MIYWLIYDISKNSARNKVVSKCKNYGLERIQKSAFIGLLSKNKAEMLSIELKEIVSKETDCVFMIPACEQCFRGKDIIGLFDEGAAKELKYVMVTENGTTEAYSS